MTLAEFNNILTNPNQIDSALTNKVEDVLEAYPYFQTARILFLKGLQNQDSFKFNTALKKTAAFATDRTVLFDFIVSDKTSQKDENSLKSITELHKDISKLSNITIKETEQALEIGKPISFTANETHSFNEWLQLGSFNPIQRDKTSENFDLIEKFIQTNPKIKPIKGDIDLSITSDKIKVNPDVMTETLAKVYLEQKKYDKAIKAYKILSLKYPEKSGFFADRIKAVQLLQKHNN